MLYKVVLTFKSVDETIVCDHSSKAVEQYIHVVLFIILHKVVLTFKSVDETLVCDHSIKSYWAILSCGTVYYALQGGSHMKPVDETLVCDHSNDSYQAVCSSGTTLSKMILTSNSVNEILLSDQSWQHSTVYYAVQSGF